MVSLAGPGSLISRRRSRTVGRASATSGRRTRRKGASRFVAGLDAVTSGSRSSRVERRFTNVVLPLRSVVGSCSSARESEAFSLEIAPIVVLALPTRAERSLRRAASVETTREVSTRKRFRAGSSRVNCCTSWSVVERNGLK